MEFKEFSENVLGKTVNIGDLVWICDYRHDDIINKPIRHVVPQKVMIVDNADLPKNKTVYYSPIHFVPLGKNDAPKKQVIAPFDNTGFRGRTGTSVNIFDSEQECRDFYRVQCQRIKAEIEVARKSWMQRFDAMDVEILAEIKEHTS